jgi:hypothetical protein
VGGTYDFVVLPAATVAVLPSAVFIGGYTMPIRELALSYVEKAQFIGSSSLKGDSDIH